MWGKLEEEKKDALNLLSGDKECQKNMRAIQRHSLSLK